VAFGVTGFAALRLEPQPQVFQALSIGATGPVPPAPPYGTPNKNLVPVQQTGNPSVPANLSVAAQGAFSAIQSIKGAPNTTSSIGARNPALNLRVQNASGTNGPVSFGLTTLPKYVTSGVQAVKETPNAPTPQLDHELQKALAANAPSTQSVPTSAPSYPPSSTPQFVLPSNGASVARIVATVNQIAISAVYPAPIFSFAA
jgi:hypothetical protein